jgi:hypothetical protein
VVVNPCQVRDFAKATGKLAKTDALDAQSWPTSPRQSVHRCARSGQGRHPGTQLADHPA